MTLETRIEVLKLTIITLTQTRDTYRETSPEYRRYDDHIDAMLRDLADAENRYEIER